MLARRTNLLPRPPVVEKAAPRPEPVKHPFSAARAKRVGKWWTMNRHEKREFLADVWETAPSIPTLANEVGCTMQNLCNLARRMGLPLRPHAFRANRTG